jgi:hypothetical protein
MIRVGACKLQLTLFPDWPDKFSRHDHGPSTVYGTALNYTAMRLLGVDKDEPLMIKARATLHALGKAVH